jgi:uncharacterized delta-60 repeat protein
MWLSSVGKTSRNPAGRATFRPQLEALEDRCLLSAGALDPTFGNGGKALASPYLSGISAVLLQPDGKIVVGGGSGNMTLLRYNADGTLDTTFGGSGTGKASSPVAPSVYGLTLQNDGKIVAVGTATVQTKVGKQVVNDSVFAVARFTPDGLIDPTFGTTGSGYVLTNVNAASRASDGYEFAEKVAIDGSGKIDVCGYTGHGSDASALFTLVRYNQDGSRDLSFANQGIAQANFPGYAYALTIQPDGKILLAGPKFSNFNINSSNYLTTTMAIVRFTTAGWLDTSFGATTPTNSVALVAPSGFYQVNPYGILMQSNGAIALAGIAIATAAVGSPRELVLARLDATGKPDTTFGSSGFVLDGSMLGDAGGIAQAANGDLVAAGFAGVSGNASTYDFGVAAYLPTGAPDTSFGTSGVTTIDFAGGSDIARAIAIQGDGKIVVAGLSSITALVRLLPSNTQIGWPTATPNPAPAGTSVTLTVSNIYDTAYPRTTVTQVSFYQDTNGNGVLDAGDIFLGTGTLNTTTGVWSFTFFTTGLKGTYTLFAQAWDGNVFYDPVAIQVTVL